MRRAELIRNIQRKRSFLCVGLDADFSRIPAHLKKKKFPLFEFNRRIIEATHDLCVAYKLNIAFYEAMGPAGWELLRKTLACIPGGILTIADAKRGDIGLSSAQYAKAFFDVYGFDVVTVNPYLGRDAVLPFLSRKGRWAALLAVTSNEGALDFQTLHVGLPGGGSTRPLYEEVIAKSSRWGNPENTLYVVGATRREVLAGIRSLIPDHFLLVPGVGAQGGTLDAVAPALNRETGLLVNVSRGIIYAGKGRNFAEKTREKADSLQRQMAAMLKRGRTGE